MDMEEPQPKLFKAETTIEILVDLGEEQLKILLGKGKRMEGKGLEELLFAEVVVGVFVERFEDLLEQVFFGGHWNFIDFI